VLRLDLRTQSDALACLAQAHAQLDIFHGGPGLVKATCRQEHRPPDSAATGPECAGLPVTVLMDIVVQQVLEEAGRVACRGIVIVAAEERHHIRLVRHDRFHAGQGIRMYHHVCVDEYQHVAGCRFRPAVARVCRTARAGRRGQHARAQRSRIRCRSVGRTIVNRDDFVGRAGRGRQSLQATPQALAAVVDRNDDRKPRGLQSRCRRLHHDASPATKRPRRISSLWTESCARAIMGLGTAIPPSPSLRGSPHRG
jgi:hypothetical protein